MNESCQTDDLFNKYKLSEEQRRIFHLMKGLRNMPTSFADVDHEQLIWAVAVGTIDMPFSPTPSDIRFYERTVEERVRRMDQAETRFGWFTSKWTKCLMKRLIVNWFCGMLVIDPNLTTKDGSPIQFVREYYGEGSHYPDPEGQTDEWKKESTDLYVLMARSTCLAYPMATKKGIVSFSDMQNFDWDKYDMESKSRNADIGSLVPNKLVRMITFHPDDKMRGFYNDMGPRARKKWGFEQYETFESAVAGEGNFLPTDLPTFVGGTYRVDVLECLKYLFWREPEALELLLETHSEMEEAGELPKPEHME